MASYNGEFISKQEDERLMAKQNKGDLKAFAALYDKYASVIYGILFKITADKVLTEQFHQVVFTKIVREFAEINNSNISLLTRVMQITRSTALEEIKVQQIKQENKTGKANNFVTNQDNYEKDGTSLKETELFNLIYYKGYSYEEAASVINIPITEVKVRIRNAIKNLCEIRIDENN